MNYSIIYHNYVLCTSSFYWFGKVFVPPGPKRRTHIIYIILLGSRCNSFPPTNSNVVPNSLRTLPEFWLKEEVKLESQLRTRHPGGLRPDRRRELNHFSFCLCVTSGCFLAFWFFPKQSCCSGSNDAVFWGLDWSGAPFVAALNRKRCYLHDLVMQGQKTISKIYKKNGILHFSSEELHFLL